jgi:hypothetical protein
MTNATATVGEPPRGARAAVGAVAATGSIAVLLGSWGVLGGGRPADAAGLVVVATSIAMLASYLFGIPVALMVEQHLVQRPVQRFGAYVIAGLAAGALVGLWWGRDLETMLWCSAPGAVAAAMGALAAQRARGWSPRRAHLVSIWTTVVLALVLVAAWVSLATSGSGGTAP